MSKNGYLEKRAALNQGFLDAGEQLGMQKMWDYIQLALRNPEVMGKDTFGKDRLIKIVKAIGEKIDYFQPAWEKCDDADYYQKEMDDSLAKVYGESLADSFYERYQFAPEFDYMKGKWKG